MALYLAAHVVVRYAVPYADPVLLPLAALLSAIGVTLIYRLEPDDAFRQSLWIVIGVVLFALTLFALRRDYRILEQYKYLFGITAILLLMLPALPGIGQTINGARLWVKVGSFQFQPGELAKIFLIVFLAGYLRDKREVLAQGRLKDFGPLLLIWGAAMLVLVQTNDLGSALLQFGIFLAMLYVATGRAAFVLAGLALFVGGAAFVYHYVSHVEERVTIWLNPWTDDPVFCAQTGELALRQDCGSFQLVKSLYSIGNGGFAGTGLGKGTFTTTSGDPIIPYLNTDFIYSAIAQELGLVGAAGLLLVFMLFVARGFRDRAARRRRLLEAARRRAHVRLRAADLHHRRRRPARDPADRDHAAVRLLRRLQRRRQLHPAGAAAAGLQPREHAGVEGPHVNKQITRLALTGVGMIVALVVATTYWQAWAAGDLADRQDNQIERVAQFTIDRGEIRGNGVIWATNRQEKKGGRTFYFRVYPQRGLAAHVVGYSTQARFRTGLERSMNDYLTGQNANLSTVLETFVDKAKGATIQGNALRLTLVPRAQRAAQNALGRRCGAVVALDVRTGKVLAMYSSPTYDPNLVEDNFDQVTGVRADCRRPDALLNRATAGLYAPGSIFKVVTASAAIDSGRFTPDSSFVDPGYCEVYGKRVNNYDTTRPFGRLDLHTALVNSVNSVFCNIGKELGARFLVDYMKRFGFYALPPLETPADERAPSGLYKGTKLFDPAKDSDVDPGRLAFGQERLLVTPLQMAMVAATIANDGVVMKPQVIDRIVAPDGSVIVRSKPERLDRAIKTETARAVGAMMKDAVEEGTGTAARIDGITVGGKTGTAETGIAGLNTTWFIAYAGKARPEVAIAVVVEQQNSTGGETAAPVAREVLQALLGSTANS